MLPRHFRRQKSQNENLQVTECEAFPGVVCALVLKPWRFLLNVGHHFVVDLLGVDHRAASSCAGQLIFTHAGVLGRSPPPHQRH